jgi:hypothetical protein
MLRGERLQTGAFAARFADRLKMPAIGGESTFAAIVVRLRSRFTLGLADNGFAPPNPALPLC